MNTKDAIMGRRAVRSWTDENVSDDQLTEILEAGRFAPSPLNSHPWHFIVLRNKDMLRHLVPEAKHGGFVSQANAVIVVTVSKNANVDAWLDKQEQYIYSGACAIENMWLLAWDMGIGGCWVSLDDEKTKQLLHIPQEEVVIGSLAVGHPKSMLPFHTNHDRKPLSEMVFYDEYGKIQEKR